VRPPLTIASPGASMSFAMPPKSASGKGNGDKLRLDRSKDGDDGELIRQDVERSSARINGAPALIAVCLTLDDMDTYPDARRNEAEFLMAVQSTAMAAQILLLKAQAEGLGACWMCARCSAPRRFAALWSAVVLAAARLMLLGWPAEPGRMRERKAARRDRYRTKVAVSVLPWPAVSAARSWPKAGGDPAAGRTDRRGQCRRRFRASWPAYLARHRHSDLHAGRLNNQEQGWGLEGETWNFITALERLGGETWFRSAIAILPPISSVRGG